MKYIIGDVVFFDFICVFFTSFLFLNGFLQMESNNLQEQLQKILVILHFQKFSIKCLAHMVGMQDYGTYRNKATLEAILKKAREEMDIAAK